MRNIESFQTKVGQQRRSIFASTRNCQKRGEISLPDNYIDPEIKSEQIKRSATPNHDIPQPDAEFDDTIQEAIEIKKESVLKKGYTEDGNIFVDLHSNIPTPIQKVATLPSSEKHKQSEVRDIVVMI